MLAGIVSDLRVVAVRADLLVPAKGRGPAAGHRMDGIPYVLLQRVCLVVGRIVFEQDRLDGRLVHADREVLFLCTVQPVRSMAALSLEIFS